LPFCVLGELLAVPVPLSHIATFFFRTSSATTEISPLSLHDALPILFPRWPGGEGHHTRHRPPVASGADAARYRRVAHPLRRHPQDRKSTRLNSSHGSISYAVFCLKKKQPTDPHRPPSHRFSETSCSR